MCAFTSLERDARVGDDRVEVPHEVVLGHGRQHWKHVLVDRGQVDVAQPLPVP